MVMDDGPFPMGRTYVYIVRCRWPDKDANDTCPATDVFLSYTDANKRALEVSRRTQWPHDIDVYEEALDHRRLKHGATYVMGTDLDTFDIKVV